VKKNYFVREVFVGNPNNSALMIQKNSPVTYAVMQLYKLFNFCCIFNLPCSCNN